MGNCFSDPSHKSSKGQGQGQKLGSAPAPSQQQQKTQTKSTIKPPTNHEPPRTLGGGSVSASGDIADPRERALKAAEERAKASQNKGVNTSNPKAGELSAKLAAENRSKSTSNNTNDQRMMDRGEWN
ncbi:hypothetical protein L486_05200 [Kwoniella mangroviensis CBS 10435]|uniref:Uncharacterized protein n=1 Tax=Kwoniella mangroviensis CBS 10435 TaxID=1331196 RepID=A0A1B9IQ99_9TREE|nr:hypothetical protein L486_05200 [Kwoniella mangroviensis CBS 10435]